MNVISKSILYYKLTHPGPSVSYKNDRVESDLTRIDWGFVDEKHSYDIKSYKWRNSYLTDIIVGNHYIITQFRNRRAKRLFDLAQSVMLKKNATIVTTAYPETR